MFNNLFVVTFIKSQFGDNMKQNTSSPPPPPPPKKKDEMVKMNYLEVRVFFVPPTEPEEWAC